MPKIKKIKRKKKENKVLKMKLENYNVPKAFREYMNERNIDHHNFGGIPGYITALIDSGVKEKDMRERIKQGFQQYIGEHFWAGVFLGKTKPEVVKVDYEEIKKEEQKKEQTGKGYFG